MDQLGTVRMKHTHREGNACADRLAKECCNWTEANLVILLEQPQCTNTDIFSDCIGVMFPRIISISNAATSTFANGSLNCTTDNVVLS